ncbi:MAG: precorrin-3B synthase [Hyphomicrobium sp.]
MTAPAELRKGWCPGALRPMETGDGLLVRVRPRAGLYALSALRAIAEVAARYGSGQIDLTNRANLQLRGLTHANWRDAVAELDDAGMIDRDAAAEAVRNVIVDPLFGLDPARADLRSLAAELEEKLAVRADLHALPGKFGFAFGDTRADITIESRDVARCAIRLDGDERSRAIVARADAVDSVLRLAAHFLNLHRRALDVRRMRDAVAASGAHALFAAVGLTAENHAAAPCAPSNVGALGAAAAPFAVGIGLPFGRIDADQLASLAVIAANLGGADARPALSRILVFPTTSSSAASALLRHAQDMGLIVEADDPRLAMDVCPGAPACRNATTETRVDAAALAAAIKSMGGNAPSVHVSGCPKGCARHGRADLTFIARDGRYDAVRDGDVDGAITAKGVAPQDLSRFIGPLP